MTRVEFEGHTLDARTRDMVIAARVICEAPMVITQGCYNGGDGAVEASAGTHDGGGVVDIRAVGRTDAERQEIVRCLRRVGFGAWLRLPEEGDWPYHVHAVAVDCPDLAPSAARQVVAYKDGRNGLKNNEPDNGPRDWVGRTWEQYKQLYPDLLTEDELSAQDVANIRADIADLKVYVEKRDQAYAAFLAKNLTQQLGHVLLATEKLDQKYAVAVNAFIQQLDAANDAQDDADLQELKDAFASLMAKVDEVDDKVDVVDDKVDALPKS